MIFNSPISIQKADQIISSLNLKPNDKIVDLGCGEGEFLSRIHLNSNSHCLGIDIDSSCIELAEQKVHQNPLGEKIQFLSADIQEKQLEKNSYDLAICIGSTHAFGQGEMAYQNALKRMNDLIKPNGLLLIGEGYWKQNPEQEYLNFIGDPVGIYNSHEQNIQQAESLGFIPMFALTSNQDEWDLFEWSFRMKAERQVIAEPDNKSAHNNLKKVREWNKYYRKYGRYTMGFGFYLYLKSEFTTS